VIFEQVHGPSDHRERFRHHVLGPRRRSECRTAGLFVMIQALTQTFQPVQKRIRRCYTTLRKKDALVVLFPERGKDIRRNEPIMLELSHQGVRGLNVTTHEYAVNVFPRRPWRPFASMTSVARPIIEVMEASNCKVRARSVPASRDPVVVEARLHLFLG
jgi:hypothetical protein